MQTTQTTQYQDLRSLAQIMKDTELAQQARDQAVQASLAKLLASENIHVEFRKVHTASFNVKSRVLIIPVFAPDLKAETISMLVEHEVGHALYTPTEGWHGTLDKRGPGFKSYLNVMEDVRIERKIKAKFPGTRKDFHLGYQDLVAQNFFGPLSNARHFQLIDKINVYSKCGPLVANFAFTPEEQALLEQAQRAETWDEVVDVALAVCKYDVERERASAEAFDAEFGKQKRGNQDMADYDDNDYPTNDGEEEADLDDLEDPYKPSKQDDDLSDLDEDAEAIEREPSGDIVINEDQEEGKDSEKEGKKTDVETPSADGLDAEEENENEEEEEPSTDDYGRQGPVRPEEVDVEARDVPLEDENTTAAKAVRRSATDEQFRSNERTLFDVNAREILYYDIGSPPPVNSVVVDYKRVLKTLVDSFVQEAKWTNRRITDDDALRMLDEAVMKSIKSFRKRHEGYITNLVRVFELKKNAEQFARASESKTGQLNLNKMHQYKFNDDLFRKIVSIPKGKNHGVLMFVDFSGSMTKVIKPVMEQAAVLAAFCRRIQVPFRVMTFTDGSRTGKHLFKTADYSVIHTDEFQFKYDNDVFMPEFFNNKMTMQEFNRALYFTASNGIKYLHGKFSMGGTPLDQCILQLPGIVQNFKKETNAEKITAIYLTDGGSTDHFFSCRFKRDTTTPLGNDYYGMDCEYINPEKHIMVFRNKWNHKNVMVEPTINERYGSTDKSYTSFSYTQAILRTVREVTGCTMLGYFVASGRDAASMISDYKQYSVKTEEQLKSEFRTQYFVSFENYGYNEYFILWDKVLSGTMSEEDQNQAVAGASAKTNKGLATAFTKMKTEAARNRVFVTKFMSMVAA